MDALGLVAATAGAALFIWSLVRTMRANAVTRIPFYRNPVNVPKGSIATRSIGAGLFVFGGVALAGVLGFWSILVVVAAPLIALTLITIHNSRLAVTVDR